MDSGSIQNYLTYGLSILSMILSLVMVGIVYMWRKSEKNASHEQIIREALEVTNARLREENQLLYSDIDAIESELNRLGTERDELRKQLAASLSNGS